ncbi:MAG: hypothetical protein IH830_05370 [Planctomycetes bacterium]|nr:hypothetical protein [Planctomycetota bacterium]
MAIQVSDAASNPNEQIENAAKAIGRSAHKRRIFEAIHHGKKARKSVTEIVKATGLTQKQVLDAAKSLVKKHVIEQERIDATTFYCKNSFLQAHKGQVMKLAGNASELAKYPTKRNPGTVSKQVIERVAPSAQIIRITIDDIPAFKKVRDMPLPSEDRLPEELSEEDFKTGMQKIIGEPGVFKDWGGEKNDLFSTRLTVERARRAVAFGFKGPGLRAKLKPKNMGANGDQALSLFDSPADVFLVQHWREIDESVIDLVERLAIARSIRVNRRVWYGVVDGKDSRRIYEAYADSFKSTGKRR